MTDGAGTNMRVRIASKLKWLNGQRGEYLHDDPDGGVSWAVVRLTSGDVITVHKRQISEVDGLPSPASVRPVVVQYRPSRGRVRA